MPDIASLSQQHGIGNQRHGVGMRSAERRQRGLEIARIVDLDVVQGQSGGFGGYAEVLAEIASCAGRLHPESPLIEIATAGDFATPMRALPTTASREEALRRSANADMPLPIADAATGRPIGIIRAGAAAK
jgi:hypothetical protein